MIERELVDALVHEARIEGVCIGLMAGMVLGLLASAAMVAF